MGESLTVQNVADRLQIHPNVVRIYLNANELRGWKLGPHWRIEEDDLADFILARKGGASPPAPRRLRAVK